MNFATAEARVTMWIHGIATSDGSIIIIIIVASIICCIIYRKFASHTRPSPVILGLSPPPQRSQRQDHQVRAADHNN